MSTIYVAFLVFYSWALSSFSPGCWLANLPLRWLRPLCRCSAAHVSCHWSSFRWALCVICLYFLLLRCHLSLSGPPPPLRPGCHSSCLPHSPLLLFLTGVSNRFELFLTVRVAFVAFPLCTCLTLVLLLFLCLSEGGGRGRGPSEEAVSRSLLPRRQVVGPRARQEGQSSKY